MVSPTMRREFAMPDVGEGLTEGEIVAWRVAPGDTVTVNQVLVEIETAKAAVELPSPFAGTVRELLAQPGETVAVGRPIVVIETTEKATSDSAIEAAQSGSATVGGETSAEPPVSTLVGYGPRSGSVRRRRRRSATSQLRAQPRSAAPAAGNVPLAKPPVRKLARDLGVDLRAVTGSGPGGVITRGDVEAAAASAQPRRLSAGGERREPIRGVRKATAEAVVRSAFTAPHVTEFLTVDVTETMALRDRLRQTPEFADVKLTPLAFVAKAACLAMRRTPEINASWDDEAGEIVYYERVQLGIATATPRGLIVPKIRDADQLSLRQLAQAISALTETARAGRTPPEDLVGGTFTITNLGVFGVDIGTPILNPGESAILALGAIKPMPWVVDGELAVRSVCQLALSFDHRLIDGEQGSRFLVDVGSLLTDPGLALTW